MAVSGIALHMEDCVLVALGVVEAVRLEHDNLIIAFVVVVLGVIRHATLGGDVARAHLRLQLVLIVLLLMIVRMRVTGLITASLIQVSVG